MGEERGGGGWEGREGVRWEGGEGEGGERGRKERVGGGGERKRREKGVDRGLELRMSTCMVRPVATTY